MLLVGFAQPVAILASVPDAGLLFGLMLVAAISGGYAARALRVPRVVGFLLAGVVLKLLLGWFLDADSHELGHAAAPLKAVKDLGLGIILFTIGGVFETRHVKSVGRKMLKMSLGESGLTCLLVFLGTGIVAVLTGGEASMALAFALLLGFAAIATAPAATMFVLREYDAKGPTTDTILSLTGVNNVICLVTFHVCFLILAASGVLGPVSLPPGSIWVHLLTTTLGSLALGVVLGTLVSIIHAKLQLAETLLILVAMLIVLGAGEGWLLEHHNIAYTFLLTALAMGATFANIAIDPDRLEQGLRTMARPVLVGFFVIAGYELHLEKLPSLGYIGITYVVCRCAGKVLGARWGIRRSKASRVLSPHLGAALLCQAAVVIGLAGFVKAYWGHAMAQQFATVVLGSVVIFEVLGPLLTKWVAVRAGEVKAVTLLRRSQAPAAGGASTLTLTWEALLRTVGIGPKAGPAAREELCARHIMRANVKCLPATADLNEVLHFVERSRYSHFLVVDDDKKLVGVIHFSDIREMMYDPFLSRLMTAVDLAGPNPELVSADMPMDDVLEVFKAADVGSLPVVESPDSRRVVGLIEQRDLLRAMHQRQAEG